MVFEKSFSFRLEEGNVAAWQDLRWAHIQLDTCPRERHDNRAAPQPPKGGITSGISGTEMAGELRLQGPSSASGCWA